MVTLMVGTVTLIRRPLLRRSDAADNIPVGCHQPAPPRRVAAVQSADGDMQIQISAHQRTTSQCPPLLMGHIVGLSCVRLVDIEWPQ